MMTSILRPVLLAGLSLLLLAPAAHADTISVEPGDPEVSLRIDTRMDGNATMYGRDALGDRPSTEMGYHGSYAMFILDGRINEHFSYSLRDRVNRDNTGDNHLVNTLDWLYLAYAPTPRLTITAGKQIALVGTIEYDYNPIDIYFASHYWNHVNPYQIGVSVGYQAAPGHRVLAQMTNSLCAAHASDNLFAYNLMWYGRVAGWLSTMYSLNAVEHHRGAYIGYLALGHRLDFGPVRADVDLMGRYAARHSCLLADYTVSGKVEVDATPRLTLFAKGGYDRNRGEAADMEPEAAADLMVPPGTHRAFWGLGGEYQALSGKRNKVRLHAYWHASTDHPRQNTVGIGVRWQMDLLHLKIK